jgi:hypothetical protein
MNLSPYKQRCYDQLIKWVNGKPTHNVVEDECCPDFSCCQSHLLLAQVKRLEYLKAFIEGDRKTMDQICFNSLGSLLTDQKAEVYLTGNPNSDHF